MIEELYQQMLAKALAHYFEAKLLILDFSDFSLKVNVWVVIFSFLVNESHLEFMLTILCLNDYRCKASMVSPKETL